ncbi:hypothetical protein PISL3812_03545 [Talaromyces islandicus]|uniref:Uncharacterized protein n=1 Tax=Talaromyces islandicus TaxID=28573 RepID=A0A0U1LT18_TALIS|nr:hypothetical protein PISL3812_03545 [Talaromyces islandicus]
MQVPVPRYITPHSNGHHRSSILSTLGIHTGVNHTAGFLLAHWFFAYGVLSTRPAKFRAGIDDNRNPRHDLAKYGERAVSEGKMTRRQLDRITRQQAAHENAVEGFAFFASATNHRGVILANIAKVDTETIDLIGVWYSASRVAYALAYLFIEDKTLSYLRSLAWWSGNLSCIMGIWWASKNL